MNPLFPFIAWLEAGANAVTLPRVLYALSATLLVPPGMAAADAWGYVVTGAAASGVEWNEARACLAGLFLIAGTWVLLAASDAAERLARRQRETAGADPRGAVKS